MTRLIDADALKKAIEEVEDNYDGYEPNDLGKFMSKVDDLIDEAPTVFFPLTVKTTDKVTDEDIEVLKRLMKDCKPQVLNLETERTQGEWVGNAFNEHHCNRCGHPALWEEEPDDYYEVQSRFCPNCGADMRGKEE